MHRNKYAIVCVLTLILTMIISSPSIHQVKANSNQFGWDNGNWFASEIHASAAGIWTGWTEDFENWNENGWGYDTINGGTFNVQTDSYAHSPTHDMIVSCSSDSSQAAMFNNFPFSGYADVVVYIKFSQLTNLGYGGSMEIVDLQGGPVPYEYQESAVAAVTYPYGAPVWTLRTYQGGNLDSETGADVPVTGQWYKVELIRDTDYGFAELFVNDNLEAYIAGYMTNPTWTLGIGICWQIGNGNNQLLFDDITEKVSGDPSVAIEDSSVQTAANNIFNLFAATNYYGHLENYMQNDNSYSTTTNVLSDIYEDETVYSQAAFLYIGHEGYSYLGNQWHYGFVAGGDNGQNVTNIPVVWDYQIYPQIVWGDHYFVFLWVCMDGSTLGGTSSSPSPYGMPYSWSLGRITSSDGYQSSDNSYYSVISFKNASPMLSTYISTGPDNGNANQLYENWLVFFYYWTLHGYSVNQALDQASYNAGYSNFNSLPSYNGGNGNLVWWNGGGGSDMNPGWYSSTMIEYGDGVSWLPPY